MQRQQLVTVAVASSRITPRAPSRSTTVRGGAGCASGTVGSGSLTALPTDPIVLYGSQALFRLRRGGFGPACCAPCGSVRSSLKHEVGPLLEMAVGQEACR